MVIGRSLGPALGRWMRSAGIRGVVVVITDRTVGALYLDPVISGLRASGFRTVSIVIPSGERQKSLRTAEGIVQRMISSRVGRDGTIVALGGGVVGDLAGFVAATFHRGIALVHVPTTLLAQVDSSIGGKVGVNHRLGKNLIGAFHQPHIVWSDTTVLQTLPPREITCGLGEILKYAILSGGPFFRWLDGNVEAIIRKERAAMLYAVRTCAGMKAEICRRDERELGVRTVLNLGHTIGHALEAAGNYRSLRHGEAVILGLRAECLIARRMRLLPDDDYTRIQGLLNRVPVRPRGKPLRIASIFGAITRDKKSVEGEARFVLPTRIGSVDVVSGVRRRDILSALREIGV